MDEKIGIEEAGDSKTKYKILSKERPFQSTCFDNGENGFNYALKKSYKKDGKWYNEVIHVYPSEVLALNIVAKTILDDCTKSLKS